MTYEYVVSGTGMFVFQRNDTENIKIINEYLSSRKDISVLFNAFTEKSHGERIKDRKFAFKNIFSDSGGLQITTLGLPVDEVKKEQQSIYDRQCRLSDVAMSFDEMAVRSVTSTSSVLSYSNRFFVSSECKQAAINTSENIKKQIEYFDQKGSSTKIMLIAQGNDLDSYNEYLSTIIDRLSDYEITRLFGIAPSSASLGNGSVQIFEMLYSLKKFDVPDELKKNIHLLGVGSHLQMLPLIYSKKYFEFIDNLSFDSTTAARKYLLDGMVTGNQRLSKNIPPEPWVVKKFTQIYDQFKYYIDQHSEWKGVDHFINHNTYYSENNTKKTWAYSEDKQLHALYAFFITMYYIEELMDNIYDPDKDGLIFNDIETWEDFLKNKRRLNTLYRLKDNAVRKVNDMIHLEKKKIKGTLL